MIITEDQEIILNYLSKYSQMFYIFSNYNDYPQWLEDERKLDKVINAVRSGEYKEDDTMINYINNCITCIKNCEFETKNSKDIL